VITEQTKKDDEGTENKKKEDIITVQQYHRVWQKGRQKGNKRKQR